MAIQHTLGMIKPDAVANKAIGEILAMIEANGLEITAVRMLRMSRAQAEAFYAVHNERPFFDELCTFMTSGRIVAFVAKGTDAIQKYRDLMGPTDSKKAKASTIRGRFGTDIEKNAVHGSDSEETARTEISFHFSEAERANLWRIEP